jgi:hypothetical protein
MGRRERTGVAFLDSAQTQGRILLGSCRSNPAVSRDRLQPCAPEQTTSRITTTIPGGFPMNKLLSILVASTFALCSASVLAADPPKDAAMAQKTEAAPKKPANVTAEAWAKMSDAEKAKAADEATKTAAAPKKKVKKGGC